MTIKLPSRSNQTLSDHGDGCCLSSPAILKGLENISDLAGIEPLRADHPWITRASRAEFKKIRAGFEKTCGYLQYLALR